MLEELGIKRHSYFLLLCSMIITITQILSTTWCNAKGEIFGYFLDDQNRYHSCVYEMPGAPVFEYGALALSVFGGFGLLAEWVRTKETWRTSQSVNLSRILFTFSFLTVNFLLEVLAKSWGTPKEPDFWSWILDNFYYLFPTALVVLVAAGWTIFNKVEVHVRLKQN